MIASDDGCLVFLLIGGSLFAPFWIASETNIDWENLSYLYSIALTSSTAIILGTVNTKLANGKVFNNKYGKLDPYMTMMYGFAPFFLFIVAELIECGFAIPAGMIKAIAYTFLPSISIFILYYLLAVIAIHIGD